MKAINSPLRQRNPEDIVRHLPSDRMRRALKYVARKQLRASERQLLLREEIAGLYAMRAADRAEARAAAEAAARAEARLRDRAARDVRRMLDRIEAAAEADSLDGLLRHLDDRVMVEREIQVVTKDHCVRTMRVRASCAV